MRVLYVATLHHPEPRLRPRLDDDPDSPLFPESQVHHFWVKAMRRLGHRCAVFWRASGAGVIGANRPLTVNHKPSPRDLFNALAARAPRVNPRVRRRNRDLLESSARFEPDVLVLVGDNEVVLPETIAAIRARHGAIVVYASGVSPIVFSRPIERDAAPLYDLVVVNDEYHGHQWRELGAPRAEVLPLAAVDPDFHRPADVVPRGRVVFVGTLVPDRLYSERRMAIEALAGPALDVWSVHAAPASLQRFHRGPALGRQMMTALRSAAIAVNPHANFSRYGGNMRLFEACGAGALQVTDGDRPGVKTWFEPGRHLLTFDTPHHLRALVERYLKDDAGRAEIARAGLEHVRTHHTYDHRMRRLFALLESTSAG